MKRFSYKTSLLILSQPVSSTQNGLFHQSHCCCKQYKVRVPPNNFMNVPIKGTFEYKLRQMKDPYVKKRYVEGYRCRSAYKLIEIDDEFKILHQGMRVLELGCAPGSWSQVLIERVYPNNSDGFTDMPGQVIGVDRTKIPPLDGAEQIVGDFTQRKTQLEIIAKLAPDVKVDAVVSDAAPNASGIRSQDHAALSKIICSCVPFVFKILKNDGTFLFKMWDGKDVGVLKKSMEKHFKFVKIVKPDACRDDSTELYILCKKFLPS